MPRPKGFRNKAKVVVENVDEKIAAVEAEIELLYGPREAFGLQAEAVGFEAEHGLNVVIVHRALDVGIKADGGSMEL